MTDQFGNLKYQLDNLLSEGFSTLDQYEVYRDLKVQYEEATGDLSFSIRELTGQLDVIMTNRETFFPDLDEGTRAAYLDLVERLEELDSTKGAYYRRQLGEKSDV